MTAIVLGVVFGIFSWLFTNFLFHPWIEVQKLRRRARFETMYWSGAERSQTRERGEPAREAFRKLALELIALNETSPNWFRSLLAQFLAYDLKEAANGVIFLSYETVGDISFPVRALYRHRVEKAFRLEMEFSDKDCEIISERLKAAEGGDPGEYDPGPAPIDGLFM